MSVQSSLLLGQTGVSVLLGKTMGIRHMPKVRRLAAENTPHGVNYKRACS